MHVDELEEYNFSPLSTALSKLCSIELNWTNLSLLSQIKIFHQADFEQKPFPNFPLKFILN